MKAWMSETDKHVSDGVNKILIQNKRGLTSKKELFTYGAKEPANSLNVRYE